jgi:hypothetical protein
MRHGLVSDTAYSAAAVLLLLMATLLQQGVSGWGNGGYSADAENPDYGTHDGIANLALSICDEDVSFLQNTYHTQFLLGTEAPDNPDYVGDTGNHHVYYYSSGLLQDDKSAVRASAIYAEGVAKLKAGDLSGAAFLIGEMSHYIADVGVFGHTMGQNTDWGAEVHHSDYERWFDDMIADHALSSAESPIPKDAYNSALQLGKAITFGEGAIKSNVWMDTNYDWSDTVEFVPSAIGSLDLAIQAVASAIDSLIGESAPAIPPVIPPVVPPVVPPTDQPDPTVPDDDTPTAEKESLSNAVIVGLTMIAVFAVSGVLLIRTRKGA